MRSMWCANSPAVLALAIVALGGCVADVAQDEGESEWVESSESALVVTNCTGAGISAAVAAGGDVVLDCGTSPVVISVPATTITVPTKLSALRPGTISLTHSGTLFSVNSATSFQVSGITFQGGSLSSVAVHTVSGSVTVSNATFQQYPGLVLSVHNNSTLVVSDSRFANNTASGFAGSIYSEGSNTTVRRCTFVSNRSNGLGGAIVALWGTLSVSDSTFVGNVAGTGAAIALSNGSHTITNSTFAGNMATSSGGAVSVASSTTATFRNCTFAGNASSTGTVSGVAQMFDSILSDSQSPSGASCQLTGTGNVQWPLARCAGFRLADPKLGSLASNGGPTQTMALLTGSAAIDRAVSQCPAADQRGVSRPRDGDGNGSAICDVGAYER